MINCDIRRYKKTDKKEVYALHVRALETAGGYIGKGPWDKDLENIEGEYIARGGEFLVAIADGKIVAMGALKMLAPDRAEIKRMRVFPDFQRQGLGQKILSLLEAHAKKAGIRVMQLDTTINQAGAQRFYEKNGYHEVRREKINGILIKDLENIYYEKELAP